METALLRTVAVLESVASVILFVMMALTFADVIGRYVFAAPIFGASEMISGLLAVLIFAGLSVTNARDEHIVVELVDRPIRALAPRTYDTIIQTFSVAVMGLITFVLAEHAVEAFTLDSRTFVLEMPLYFITATVAVLCAISAICLVAGIWLRFRTGRQGLPDDDEGDRA